MAENRTFTLIGKFDDQITKKLVNINKELAKLNKPLKTNNATKSLSEGFKAANNELKDISKGIRSLENDAKRLTKPLSGITSNLTDAAKVAGKVRDTVSQIGEGVKGLDSITESLTESTKAASRAQEEVSRIGESAGKANRQADDLMTTLLKAEGLSKFGDAMARGFERGMRTVISTAQRGAGLVAKLFREAAEDEMADIKAASGIQGSFGLAGFKGEFTDAQKMYKKYDQVVSEMIRQSSAPTAKVVELQRYTLDTMGPLMLAAQGVKKGFNMKDIDPKKIEDSAKVYGQFLEKAALFSQGTGSAGFRVAAGIEQLVTRGKIDTTIDFFTDNIMLMKNLEAAGFAGRNMRTSKLMSPTATDADRLKAMMEAFNKSMSSESTAAMAQSLTGSIQGLQDTIFNPSVGILGMAVTFGKEEQARANKAIERIQNARILAYRTDLKSVEVNRKRAEELRNNVEQATLRKRAEELRNNIEQATLTRDKLIKNGANVISTPFKAFSYAFTGLIRSLTDALNSIGPVWSQFALSAIEVTNRVFGPLSETLSNVASNMRSKDESKRMTQAQGFGRILGEIFKTIGKIMGDIANMIRDPNSAMGKVQSEFIKGFLEAFKGPGSLEAAKKGLRDGLSALMGKLFEFLWSVISSEPIRPLIMPLFAALFGPPLISAVISGVTPLIVNSIFKMVSGSLLAAAGSQAAAPAALKTAAHAAPWVEVITTAAAPASAAPASAAPASAAIGASTLVGLTLLIAGFVIFDKQLLQFSEWIKSIGKGLENSKNIAAVGFSILLAGVGTLLEGLTNTIKGLFDIIVGLVTGDIEKVKQGFTRMMEGIVQTLGGLVVSVIGIATTLGGTIVEVVRNLFIAIWEGVTGIKQKAKPETYQVTKGSSSRWNKEKNQTEVLTDKGWVKSVAYSGSPGVRVGSLGHALKEEMANKPSGSHLVIANSSETVIPAAGGYGMKSFIDSINSGFESLINHVNQNNAIQTENGNRFSEGLFKVSNQVVQTQSQLQNLGKSLGKAQEYNNAMFSAIQSQATSNHSQTLAMFSKIGQQMSQIASSGGGGGLLGGALGTMGGGLSAASALAQSMGLVITSTTGGRHAPGSYHYAGRAIDVGGNPSSMLAFAQRLASTTGGRMAELFYTPLGYSIKNGVKVPWTIGGHMDHVHVAYAYGKGNPAFFSSRQQAENWERKMMPMNARVASITSNSSEGFGTSTINAPITIYQQPNQDPEELAAIVAMRIGMVVDEMRNH